MPTTSPLPSYSSPRNSSASRPSRYNSENTLATEEARLRSKIAALQAKQRRQRLEEDLRPPVRKSGTGIRFASAFLIVMAIHVAAIGGFYGVSSIRKMHASDKLALDAKQPVYTGVPDAAPQPVKAAPSALAKTTPSVGQDARGSGGKKSKLIAASVPTTPPINTEAKPVVPGAGESAAGQASPKSATSLKPSPAIRALFARGHSPTSSSDRSSTSSSATKALASMAPVDPEAPTVVPVATPRPTPAPPSRYTVGPGDTLSKVASMMGMPASKIRDANVT